MRRWEYFMASWFSRRHQMISNSLLKVWSDKMQHRLWLQFTRPTFMPRSELTPLHYLRMKTFPKCLCLLAISQLVRHSIKSSVEKGWESQIAFCDFFFHIAAFYLDNDASNWECFNRLRLFWRVTVELSSTFVPLYRIQWIFFHVIITN